SPPRLARAASRTQDGASGSSGSAAAPPPGAGMPAAATFAVPEAVADDPQASLIGTLTVQGPAVVEAGVPAAVAWRGGPSDPRGAVSWPVGVRPSPRGRGAVTSAGVAIGVPSRDVATAAGNDGTRVADTGPPGEASHQPSSTLIGLVAEAQLPPTSWMV